MRRKPQLKMYLQIPAPALNISYIYFLKDSSAKREDSTNQIPNSFNLRNTTSYIYCNIELCNYGPVKKNSVQACLDLKSSYQNKFLADGSDKQILHYKISQISPHAIFVLTVRAGLLPSKIANLVSIDNLAACLLSEEHVETDDPNIRITTSI
jgi:hypothetical protein